MPLTSPTCSLEEGKMHTSAKGDLGVVKAIARLTELSWNVGVLITEHQHYDLLAEKNGKMIRVQVKYAPIKRGIISADLRCIWANTSGTKVRQYTTGDYDVLALYCPDSDKCYFIQMSEVEDGTRSIGLSLKKTHWTNRLAEDYEKI
jgi:PD-(D/E)XK endonuclease